MTKQENQHSLEENFERLDALLEQLEAEDISLEEAFAAYSKGMNILKECNEQIDRVEKKVLKLSAQGELEEL
ncbi:MAG: exodeoxyribonuclease VII small subunit [Lachnospiraceae bacterium]|nr:exodeoxyribonuclease VII small subunit [Lachnospiraceae bacterium]